MDTSNSTSSALDAVPSAQMPLSVWRYGIMCFFGLIVTLLVLAVFTKILGLSPFHGLDVIGLPFSIHFANWRFVRKFRRPFLPAELNWFALSCGVAFYICDESLSLFAAFVSDQELSSVEFAELLVAMAVNLAIVGTIVYGTVPWVSRRILRTSA